MVWRQPGPVSSKASALKRPGDSFHPALLTDRFLPGVRPGQDIRGLATASESATLEFNEVLTGGTPASTHTFTDVDFGTAADDRRILISISSNSGTATFTGTIGGVAFTTVASLLVSGGQAVGLMMANVPTGTSGTVYISHGTGSVAVGVWSLYDAAPKVYDSATDNATSTATATADLDVPEDGIAFGVVSSGSGANVTWSWTGATEDFDAATGQNYINGSGASVEVPAGDASLTLTATKAGGSGTTHEAGAFVSFGPIGDWVVFDSSEWSGKTGNFTISSDDAVGSAEADQAIRYDIAFGGDFTLEGNTVGGTGNNIFGVYATSEDGSFNEDAPSLGIGVTNRWELMSAPMNNMAFDGSRENTTTTLADGDYWQIKRSGSTFSFGLDNTTQNGTSLVDQGNWSTTSDTEVRFHIASGKSGAGCKNLKYTN